MKVATRATGSEPRAQTAPTLDIVIVVSRGDRENIRGCLASLDEHPFTLAGGTVKVVDNASGDGTVELVRERFPWARVLPIGRNAGFAVANNVAIREGSGRYVLVLNPDTEFADNALDRMVELMEARNDVGVAGCRLVRPDGTLDHASKRSFPTVLGALGHFTGLGRRVGTRGRLAQYRAPELDETESGQVDAVNGAFMLVRRRALDEVGLLDEGYWIYGEDLDWCYRFKQHGWTVWYEGSVTVVHKKAGTTGSYRRLRQNAAFHVAMIRFYRRYYAGRRPLLDLAVYAGVVLKFTASALRSGTVRALRATRASLS